MAIDKDLLKKTLREIQDEEAQENQRKQSERDTLKKELRKEIVDDLLRESEEHEGGDDHEAEE